MKHVALNVVCLLVVGVSLLAFPPRAGAQCGGCSGGSCIATDYFNSYPVTCQGGCYGGLSSFNIIIPGQPDGYGDSAEWFPNQCTETCCFGYSCMAGLPQNGCPIQVLRRDLKPDEMFAVGLDMPFLFVRGCDGKYSVVSFLSAS
jgi:hypothetical protein